MPSWTRVRASLRLARADCLVGGLGCGALITLAFIMMAEYLENTGQKKRIFGIQ